MTEDELLTLAAEQPEVVKTTTNALKRTVEFYKRGRGAMLRSLRLDPHVAAIVSKLQEPSSGVPTLRV